MFIVLLNGAKTSSEATITALEAPYRIAWKAGIPQRKRDDFFNLVEWGFILEPRGEATHLTHHFHWKPQNPVAERMVKAAGVVGLQNAVTVSLVKLKHNLETM